MSAQGIQDIFIGYDGRDMGYDPREGHGGRDMGSDPRPRESPTGAGLRELAGASKLPRQHKRGREPFELPDRFAGRPVRPAGGRARPSALAAFLSTDRRAPPRRGDEAAQWPRPLGNLEGVPAGAAGPACRPFENWKVDAVANVVLELCRERIDFRYEEPYVDKVSAAKVSADKNATEATKLEALEKKKEATKEAVARDVANAFWKAEVCGGALAELLLDSSRSDLLLAEVLPRLGSRAAVVSALRAYVAAHGHEGDPPLKKREVTGEEKKQTKFPLPPADQNKPPVLLCLERFSNRDTANVVLKQPSGYTFATLAAKMSSLHNDAAISVKKTTNLLRIIPLPLYVTVLIKELKEEVGNKDQVLMVGTLWLRSFIDTDMLVGADGQRALRPFLTVNDSEETKEAFILQSSKVKLMSHNDGNNVLSPLPMRVTKYAFTVATKRRTIFAKAPFNITSFEIALVFEPFDAKVADGDADGELYQFVPDVLCPTKDLRNLVNVREQQLDELNRFDIFNYNPTVEVELVTTSDGVTFDDVVHCPNLKITFYGDTDAVRSALNIVIPIIFIAFGNMLNIFYVDGYNDFLANALTLGLTLVFFLPQLNELESVSNQVDWNQFLVILLFSGLLLGLMDCKRCNERVDHLMPLNLQKLRHAVRWGSVTLLWVSISIPLTNLVLYVRLKAKLRGTSFPLPPEFASSGNNFQKGSWFTGGKPKNDDTYSSVSLVPFWKKEEPVKSKISKEEEPVGLKTVKRVNKKVLNSEFRLESFTISNNLMHREPWRGFTKEKTEDGAEEKVTCVCGAVAEQVSGSIPYHNTNRLQNRFKRNLYWKGVFDWMVKIFPCMQSLASCSNAKVHDEDE